MIQTISLSNYIASITTEKSRFLFTFLYLPIKRYFRVVVPLFVVSLIVHAVSPYFFTGAMGLKYKDCDTEETFLCGLLLLDMNNLCIGWAWYLAIDYLMFLINLPILYINKFKPSIALKLAYLLIATSMIYTFVIFYKHNIPYHHFESNFNEHYYTSAEARAAIYFIGVAI